MARRTTSPRVRFIDAASRVLITVGGVGIIAAVLAIMAYLLGNVTPLFKSGRILATSEKAGVVLPATPVVAALDEYRGSAVLMFPDGGTQAIAVNSWTLSPRVGPVLPEGVTVTSLSQLNEAGKAALGLSDGSVQVVEVGHETTFLSPSEATEAMRALKPGDRLTLGPNEGFVERTPQLQFRRTSPRITSLAPVTLSEGQGPVVRVDFRSGSSAQFLVALREDGTLVFNTVNIVRPLGGGRPRTRLSSETIPFAPPKGAGLPDYIFAKDDGAEVMAIWKNGTAQRYAKTSSTPWVLADTLNVLPTGRTITAARMLLGSKTVIVGDDQGGIAGVFSGRTQTIRTPDGAELVVAHRYDTGFGQPVTAIGISLRDRCFVIGDKAGNVVMLHMTSGKTIVRLPASSGGEPIAMATVAPKLDGLLVVRQDGQAAGSPTFDLVSLAIEPGHPEASVSSLFGKVWYEGDDAPKFTYQASTGEDTAETKYSKVPLIFGTIKATLYAMLFAVPIAILAAIYTSEFLHPRVKNVIKPVIEMMASLPSVVLGFLAAIVIAPLFRDYLPGVLMAFFILPISVLLAAYLWQILPIRITTRLSSYQHLAMIVVICLAAGAAGIGLGRVAERVLFAPTTDEQLVLAGSVTPVPREQWPESVRDKRAFDGQALRPYRAEGLYYGDASSGGGVVRPAGSVTDPAIAATIKASELDRADIRKWLDGTVGLAWPGWLLVLTGPGLIVASLLRGRLVDRYVQSLAFARVGTSAAVLELVKFILTVVTGLGLAALGAGLLSGIGLDARDSVLGSYTQRNTLVVGIVMGFAVIPIIYTISEDALSAVPGQLRSASLGCGATRWQTATQVVLPIALSGIFSAVMIGLGRAAGETMIVLMATGNTPDMTLNLFAGFRTLAANIAVEMPEAAKDSTHYYVLFLGALCLFALTFVVNTVAELVRIRVRRRSASL